MSVLTSLMAGDGLGNDGARLLYSTMRSVVTTYNFPPPDGFSSWDEDATATSAHDFLTGPRATERLVQLAILATDDSSFERLLYTAVHNFMRDQGRRTVVGSVIRRLKDVVGQSDRFAVSGERVHLTNGSYEAFGGDEAVLVRTALQVDAPTRRWRPDSQRQGPLASRDDMVAMVQAVLTAADGSLTFAALSRVIARRFDLDPLPATDDVPVLHDPRSSSEYALIDVGDQVAAVVDQLTEAERLVLPLLDMSCRDAARLLPYGHSKIAKTQASLRTLLQQVLPPGDAGAPVLRAVLERLAGEP